LFGWILGVLGQGEEMSLERQKMEYGFKFQVSSFKLKAKGQKRSQPLEIEGKGQGEGEPQALSSPEDAKPVITTIYRWTVLLMLSLGISLLLFLTVDEYKEAQADFWYKRGQTFLSQRHTSRALESLHRSLTIYPFKPAYWMDFGRALQVAALLTDDSKIIVQAENSYLNALKLNPYNGYYWDGLANFYRDIYGKFYRNGSFKAREALKKGLSLDPYNNRLWKSRGDLEAQSGKSAQARLYYKKSLELYPGNEALKNRTK
jgi:tetratricopeptide (TPR) repeat protein